MSRDPRYDILFEPVTIGPVTAPNRFYQVPHCSGMGYSLPKTLAAMRGSKAEGGWGVVCTEYCSIHPTSDDTPFPHATLWDDEDVRSHALMCDQVHAHGSLAGVELWHGGRGSANLLSREIPLGAASMPVGKPFSAQSRAMDKDDIRKLRRWHRDAALRAKAAGFDIVYVYATHGYLISQFLSRANNRRTDEYGGSLENRARLTRELIEETKDAVGDSCGIAVRFSTSVGPGAPAPIERGEQQDIFAMLAELPDIWDINISDYTLEAGVSRFVNKAGWNEPYYDGFKAMTTKPLVGVGRFTAPDVMVRQITQGRLDMIGAARPSIADPYLPNKIKEGRDDDIRECIGCNVCIASDRAGVPLRCTQNPTMGEEWRRGWHPETIAAKKSDDRVLVVGAGPAGLEAARALGQRGYAVTVAEAADAPGGRVSAESALHGLGEWARVRDWRVHQIRKMANVEMFFGSRLDAEQVREYGFPHVVIATGSQWRGDGVGRSYIDPIAGHHRATVFTPDDVMAGVDIPGPMVVFDDDHVYMGGVIAETLAASGNRVTLVTTAGEASPWADYSEEIGRVNKALVTAGVDVMTNHLVTDFDDDGVGLAAVYGDAISRLPAASLVMVTARIPDDDLYYALKSDEAALAAAGIKSVTRVGDCLAPDSIAAAVYSGHGFAQGLDEAEPGEVPFKRERATV
jgi:dimethylamine/trimethylamine dehydrogenase